MSKGEWVQTQCIQSVHCSVHCRVHCRAALDLQVPGSTPIFALRPPCRLPHLLQDLALRAVLTPRNEHVHDLNEVVLVGFPAERIHTLPCATSIQGGIREDYATYPVDYLNSLDLPGLPPAVLRLCRRVVVVLLGNVDYEGGLCNGTRALIIDVSPRVIDVLLLSGRCAGRRTFLPSF